MADFDYSKNPLKQNPNLLGRKPAKKMALPKRKPRVPFRDAPKKAVARAASSGQTIKIPGTNMKAKTITGVKFDTSGTR